MWLEHQFLLICCLVWRWHCLAPSAGPLLSHKCHKQLSYVSARDSQGICLCTALAAATSHVLAEGSENIIVVLYTAQLLQSVHFMPDLQIVDTSNRATAD